MNNVTPYQLKIEQCVHLFQLVLVCFQNVISISLSVEIYRTRKNFSITFADRMDYGRSTTSSNGSTANTSRPWRRRSPGRCPWPERCCFWWMESFYWRCIASPPRQRWGCGCCSVSFGTQKIKSYKTYWQTRYIMIWSTHQTREDDPSCIGSSTSNPLSGRIFATDEWNASFFQIPI